MGCLNYCRWSLFGLVRSLVRISLSINLRRLAILLCRIIVARSMKLFWVESTLCLLATCTEVEYYVQCNFRQAALQFFAIRLDWYWALCLSGYVLSRSAKLERIQLTLSFSILLGLILLGSIWTDWTSAQNYFACDKYSTQSTALCECFD